MGCTLGRSHAVRDIPRLIALWQAGRLDLEALVTACRPLAEVNQAMDACFPRFDSPALFCRVLDAAVGGASRSTRSRCTTRAGSTWWARTSLSSPSAVTRTPARVASARRGVLPVEGDGSHLLSRGTRLPARGARVAQGERPEEAPQRESGGGRARRAEGGARQGVAAHGVRRRLPRHGLADGVRRPGRRRHAPDHRERGDGARAGAGSSSG